MTVRKFGSVFVSGQPSSIWVSRARGPFQARPSASELDISVSSLTSSASLSHPRIPTIELGFHLSRSVQIELSFYFLHSGTDRARFLFIALWRKLSSNRTLSSSVNFSVEGWVGTPFKFISPVKKLVKSLFSFTPSRTSETTVESQLSLPICAHILSCHLT